MPSPAISVIHPDYCRTEKMPELTDSDDYAHLYQSIRGYSPTSVIVKLRSRPHNGTEHKIHYVHQRGPRND